MKIKVTDKKSFKKIDSVDLSELTGNSDTWFQGTLSIYMKDGTQKDITGAHGFTDYDDDFGFIISD